MRGVCKLSREVVAKLTARGSKVGSPALSNLYFIGQVNAMIIFVFGSNLAGRHGAGSAKYAVQNHGAIYGQGVGLQGNSYALPTKDEHIKTLPLERIEEYVKDFIRFACKHPEHTFNVVPIGCGLARIPVSTMKRMFLNALSLPNVNLPKKFGGTLVMENYMEPVPNA